MWKRSDTSTADRSRFGSRNVLAESGVAKTARLRAWNRQNSESSIRSASESATAATSAYAVPASTS